jgi:hypothetical protein
MVGVLRVGDRRCDRFKGRRVRLAPNNFGRPEDHVHSRFITQNARKGQFVSVLSDFVSLGTTLGGHKPFSDGHDA